jgi:hypothetical protein
MRFLQKQSLHNNHKYHLFLSIGEQLLHGDLLFSVIKKVQCDQKENKSKQALQIIDHVIAEFYANKRSMHERSRRQFVVSNATL